MEYNKSLDLQNIANDKPILKQLDKDQIIMMSALVSKYNHVNKKQERVLLITNKNIYNIIPKGGFLTDLIGSRIKRKIPYDSIQSITLSRFGPEFVIHIDKEHDYRFSSDTMKLKLVETICTAYCSYYKKKMPLYYLDDFTLENYTTTLIDLDNSTRKTHQVQPQYVDSETLKQDSNQNNKAAQSSLIFKSKNSTNVSGFEEFELKKVLGKGAFGKVMLCQRKDTKEYFAVKSMRKQNLIDKQHLEKTRTERKLLEIASHPFLVNLQYAFQTIDKVFFVMKFLRGGELFKQLRRLKRFSQQQARFYSAQVLLGLEYLHSQGYVYRDLKPENILFDIDGYIKISDYGLAKQLKPNEKTYSQVGTPDYVAPQIINNSGHTFTVDWWSFGILIFEMVYGMPPFYNKDQGKMLLDITTRPLFFDDTKVQASIELKSLLTRLLKKNPQERLGFKGASEIKSHEWFQSMNFEKLLKKQLTPEILLEIGNQTDVNNFDEQFTKQSIEVINDSGRQFASADRFASAQQIRKGILRNEFRTDFELMTYNHMKNYITHINLNKQQYPLNLKTFYRELSHKGFSVTTRKKIGEWEEKKKQKEDRNRSLSDLISKLSNLNTMRPKNSGMGKRIVIRGSAFQTLPVIDQQLKSNRMHTVFVKNKKKLVIDNMVSQLKFDTISSKLHLHQPKEQYRRRRVITQHSISPIERTTSYHKPLVLTKRATKLSNMILDKEQGWQSIKCRQPWQYTIQDALHK